MIGEDIWTPGTAGRRAALHGRPGQGRRLAGLLRRASAGTWTCTTARASQPGVRAAVQGRHAPARQDDHVVPGIGVEKAGSIFYKANTDLFTASTTFEQAKTVHRCRPPRPWLRRGRAVASVKAAWEAVGVGVPIRRRPCNPLTNGVAVTGLSGASGQQAVLLRWTCPARQAA